ncbi:DUF3857 domain-containing transglutaminase family protein [Phenylobacterium terrae]|uniref:DUF3857 domain-containing transglutaminase family protein n=1 Tax=Phenylobacterium terrae TaxID=2665495 RepID=A0ABW4N3H9_9CAUL
MYDERAGTGTAPQQVAYGPAPDWIDAPAFVPRGRPAEHDAHEGRWHLFADAQFRLDPELCQYFRRVSQVVSPDGLHEAAQLDVSFDPGFERLRIHHVRVIRDGVVREVDPTAGLEVFRREPNLERAVYDGRLTAHYVVPDVRVGDIVDTAYSIEGGHPTLRGRFGAEFSFNWSCWVGETRVRLLASPARPITWKTFNAPPPVEERRLEDGLVERVWRSRDTGPAPWEPDVPPWIRRFDTVLLSDVQSWSEAADLFRGAYGTDEPPPEDLAAEIDRLAAEHPDPADQAVAALRLVQSGLRYQSVSIGEGGYAPRPVSQIWARRTGDCKDASRLLVAMLRRLGLEADPALVNTWRGQALADEPPSATAFDHCLVRLKLGGRVYWLDPTRFPQGGRLEVLHQPRFGWALPLVPAAELEAMGEEPVRKVVEMQEVFTIGAGPGDPADLRIETTYRSWRADEMRRRVSGGRAALSRDFLGYYRRMFGEAQEAAPLEAEDDLANNELRTRERYRLDRPFEVRDGGETLRFLTPDDLFATVLAPARTAARRWPVHLGPPRKHSCITDIVLPREMPFETWDRVFEMEGLVARSRLEVLDGPAMAARLTRSVEITRPVIPAEEAERYFALREAAIEYAGVMVPLTTKGGRFVRADGSDDSGSNIARWIFIALVMAFIGAMFRLAGAVAP